MPLAEQLGLLAGLWRGGCRYPPTCCAALKSDPLSPFCSNLSHLVSFAPPTSPATICRLNSPSKHAYTLRRGYACCHSTVKQSYCVGAAGREAATDAAEQLAANMEKKAAEVRDLLPSFRAFGDWSLSQLAANKQAAGCLHCLLCSRCRLRGVCAPLIASGTQLSRPLNCCAKQQTLLCQLLCRRTRRSARPASWWGTSLGRTCGARRQRSSSWTSRRCSRRCGGRRR